MSIKVKIIAVDAIIFGTSRLHTFARFEWASIGSYFRSFVIWIGVYQAELDVPKFRGLRLLLPKINFGQQTKIIPWYKLFGCDMMKVGCCRQLATSMVES